MVAVLLRLEITHHLAEEGAVAVSDVKLALPVSVLASAEFSGL